MIGKLFALATFVAGGIIAADFLTHPAGTKQLADSAVTTEKVAANALLGKTS